MYIICAQVDFGSPDRKVKFITAGEENSFAIVKSSHLSHPGVYVWGANTHGQLGNPKQFKIGVDVFTPTFSEDVSKSRPKKISCNFFHGVALSTTGTQDIFTWSLDRDLLGRRDMIAYVGKAVMPDTVGKFNMGEISTYTDIAAGYSHTLAIDSNGKLYSWGKIRNGVELSVCGQPADLSDSVLLPRQVTAFNVINKISRSIETLAYVRE